MRWLSLMGRAGSWVGKGDRAGAVLSCELSMLFILVEVLPA